MMNRYNTNGLVTMAAALGAVVMLSLASCADTEQYIGDDDTVVRPAWDKIVQQWEATLPSAGFIEPNEVVPTDELDPDYDNYIENQDFKQGRIVDLVWTNDSIMVSNPQADKGVVVTTNGTFALISNTESSADADDARGKVTYRLSGKCSDGQLWIYSEKKFRLLLDGLELTSREGSAINIQSKKRCFVVCQEGTVSKLCDNESYLTDNVDPEGCFPPFGYGKDEKGCLFSEGQLIFYGPGRLEVQGKHQHGIASDEYIFVHPSSNITVTAVKDGIHSKEQYQQTGGIVRSYAEKDALQSDTLGIQVRGGYLYLFGERGMTANGGGQISVSEPGRTCEITWSRWD